MQTKLSLIAALLLAGATSAHAGSNQCYGAVKVDQPWTTISGSDLGSYPGYGCRVLTNSKIGRRILAACPNGSGCVIYIPLSELPKDGSDLPPKVKTITAIDSVAKDDL